MSASFWQKAQGIRPQYPAAPPPPAYTAPGYPQAPQYQQPQYAPQQPAPQGYQSPEGLAVGGYARAADQAGQLAAQQGYIKKPPQWMQDQPYDKCPQCGGVNFAIHGESVGASTGAYGKRHLIDKNPNAVPFQFARCFDCGYASNGRAQSDSQIGNAANHSINSGGAVQATRQAHGLRNFFQIPAGR